MARRGRSAGSSRQAFPGREPAHDDRLVANLRGDLEHRPRTINGMRGDQHPGDGQDRDIRSSGQARPFHRLFVVRVDRKDISATVFRGNNSDGSPGVRTMAHPGRPQPVGHEPAGRLRLLKTVMTRSPSPRDPAAPFSIPMEFRRLNTGAIAAVIGHEGDSATVDEEGRISNAQGRLRGLVDRRSGLRFRRAHPRARSPI